MYLLDRWKAIVLAGGLLACAAAPHFHSKPPAPAYTGPHVEHAAKTKSFLIPRRHVTDPCIRCGIPCRDYIYKKYSQPQIAFSLPVTPSLTLPDTRIGDTVIRESTSLKVFQFEQTDLTIDHCKVSRMALQLQADGRWALSLQADQNPVRINPIDVTTNVTTIEPPRKFTEHLKRNEFVITLRCYAGTQGVATSNVGQPVVVPIYPEPFWVQKAEPYDYHEAGQDEAIARYFSLIDRVELEFRYRLAAYERPEQE